MKRHVLVIGCGHIGQIKARIWHSLGAQVYIYDRDTVKLKQLLEQCEAYQEFIPGKTQLINAIADISTPTSAHTQAFKWVVREFIPQTILIEKPLTSTGIDLETLSHEVEVFRASYPATNIYVNETYYWSKALAKLKEMIDRDSLHTISIELSKDRTSDNRAGRFFDHTLGAFGIEMPHIVAILQYLGVDISVLRRATSRLIVESDEEFLNQGAELTSYHDGLTIKASSYLGNFRLSGDRRKQPNTLIRQIVLTDAQGEHRLEFDPVISVERYHSRITTRIDSTNSSETVVDDHLKIHLEAVLNNEVGDTMSEYLSFQNHRKVLEILMDLRRNALSEIVASSNDKIGVKA